MIGSPLLVSNYQFAVFFHCVLCLFISVLYFYFIFLKFSCVDLFTLGTVKAATYNRA